MILSFNPKQDNPFREPVYTFSDCEKEAKKLVYRTWSVHCPLDIKKIEYFIQNFPFPSTVPVEIWSLLRDMGIYPHDFFLEDVISAYDRYNYDLGTFEIPVKLQAFVNHYRRLRDMRFHHESLYFTGEIL